MSGQKIICFKKYNLYENGIYELAELILGFYEKYITNQRKNQS